MAHLIHFNAGPTPVTNNPHILTDRTVFGMVQSVCVDCRLSGSVQSAMIHIP